LRHLRVQAPWPPIGPNRVCVTFELSSRLELRFSFARLPPETLADFAVRTRSSLAKLFGLDADTQITLHWGCARACGTVHQWDPVTCPYRMCSASDFIVDVSPVPRSSTLHRALVIGNGAYPPRTATSSGTSFQELPQAEADACSIRSRLRRLGYSVDLVLHGTGRVMEEAVTQFVGSLTPGCTVVVYYSGHAVERGGKNVLLPVDFDPDSGLDVGPESSKFQIPRLLDCTNLRGS
jgi:hypothetical protein